PITKTPTLTIAKALTITTRTIPKRLPIPITKTPTLTIAKALTITTRTIPKRLALAAAKTVTAVPGAESAWISTGIVARPEGASFVTIATVLATITAVAAIVLSHAGFLLL
ncbi:hypothetical protein, partial [Arthrobacter sp. M4]|uniref:hypothetical protein n=1 Tax=Arthrobacter sp. M4 TaxID=218160 RepID=UPI001CDD6D59